MRISGGDARGVRLQVPKGARPASERVRQAIFSSIAARVPGSRVLDLFCGSGAYGLEALSRGADAAIFIDNAAEAIATTKVNAKTAGYADVTSVRKADARAYLRRSSDTFDLVFADPPYADDTNQELTEAITARLNPGGTAVIEARKGSSTVEPPEGCILEADRRYGDTRVLVLRRGEDT